MRKYIFILVSVFCALGCRQYDIDEVLLQREDVSLTIKGVEQLAYEELTFQLGYNEERNEFRLFDDNMANWFTLSCAVRPSSVGQEIKADLSWTTSSSTRTKNDLIFEIKRIDSEGHVWMWCKDASIGVTVKIL